MRGDREDREGEKSRRIQGKEGKGREREGREGQRSDGRRVGIDLEELTAQGGGEKPTASSTSSCRSGRRWEPARGRDAGAASPSPLTGSRRTRKRVEERCEERSCCRIGPDSC
eukprot:344807-Hanusia_phi.AAC.8